MSQTDDLFICYVYVIATGDGPGVSDEWADVESCKIGVSRNPRARCKEMQIGCPFPIRVCAVFRFESRDFAFKVESQAHDLLKNFRLSGEWFECTVYDAVISIVDSILLHKLVGWNVDLKASGVSEKLLLAVLGPSGNSARKWRRS